MKITNGKIIIGIGIIHTLLTPLVYSAQFRSFAKRSFMNINYGFLESGLNYETFAAFWCLFFGLLLFPLGILLDNIEKRNVSIPRAFIFSYLIIILAGVYMIPLG
jgi:hypothetical protein